MVNILLNNNNNNNNKRRMSIRKALADSGCSKNMYYNNKDHTNYITAVTASTEPSSSSSTNRNKKQNICLDKAYHSKEVEQVIVKRRWYILHIKHRREEKRLIKKYPARRWVIERTNQWHNRFRKLFTRYEKKNKNYLVPVKLANSVIVIGG